MQIQKKSLELILGEQVQLYTLSNDWMSVSVLTLGCTITDITVPGRDLLKRNIVLHYDDYTEYVDDPYYVGCIVGRYAGRISGASFSIDGHSYALSANDGNTGNHLHGGVSGFNKKNFTVISASHTGQSASLKLYYQSADGEEGYPGNVHVWVTVTLTESNEVIFQYRAASDKKTHINLTNHTYFNFTGEAVSATNHELQLNAHDFVETGNNYIPTGVIRNVEGTAHDFNNPKRICQDIHNLSTGYNECFVLDRNVAVNAVLSEESSGIRMSVSTSMPGLLLYTGDFLGGRFVKNQGLCLETQFFPDSPNQQHFPSTLIELQKEYVHYTRWSFDHTGKGK